MSSLKWVLSKSPSRGLIVHTFKNIGSGAKRLWLHRNFQTLLRFVVVSCTTAGINVSIATTLVVVCGMYYLWAMVVGFFFQVSIESALNRRWTFRAQNLRYVIAFALTAVVEFVCLWVAMIITWYCVEYMGLGFTVSRILSLAVTGALSLAGAALITFRKQKSRQ
jgi:putative flippase GtrA